MASVLRRLVVMAWGLGAVAANAQEVTDEFPLSEVERVESIHVGSDEPYYLLVKPKGAEEPAVISSSRPAEFLALPGADRHWVHFSPTSKGAVVTWVGNYQVQQLWLSTGERRTRPQPFAERFGLRAVGPSGEVVVDGKRATGAPTQLAVLTGEGQSQVYEAPPGRLDEVSFTADGSELFLKCSDAAWLLRRSDKALRKHEGRPPPLASQLASTYEARFLEHGSVQKNEKLEVRDYATVYWSADDGTGHFAILQGALLYVATAEGGLSVKRVTFPGGISAWTKTQAFAGVEASKKELAQREAERAARKAKAEADDRAEFDRLAAGARKEAEALEAKRRVEEAALMRAEQERHRREVAPLLAAEKLAAERARKEAPPAATKPTLTASPSPKGPGDRSRAVRSEMVAVASVREGFTSIALERFFEDRPGVVYLGTPRVPPHANEVLVMVAGEPSVTAAIGISHAQVSWGQGGVSGMWRVHADDVRSKQLFAKVVGKPGVSKVPVYVMVFWR